ncbi:outer membrane beta-barrel protein [Galbibacter sp. BG1]|uniref:outer membrane beta-barrel protein n=1 Tax=Galbibacter sp. BG1 TaxID=1170699 RepID=UPI0015C194A6|nr:outer membrane beta-barrel protein [Galbibacter sp. BG1]QLE01159.1 outer membrane beta-barrel protein [Galbibacter sp. BG1]
MKNNYLLLFLLVAFQLNAQNEQPSNFRIAINGGYSYRIAEVSNTDPELRDLEEDLMTGFNLGVDATYFFKQNPNWGLGIAYSFSKYEVNVNSFFDKIYFNYVGATANYRYLFGENHGLKASSGFGPLFYYESFNYNNFIATTIGFTLDVGYDYYISRRIAIGAEIGFLAANINTITDHYGEEYNIEEMPISGTRLDFNLEISYNW